MTATFHLPPTPIILRGVDGRVEPFEPRAHPIPWSRKLAPRERRRWARLTTYGRGRRGARAVPRVAWLPADRLRSKLLHRANGGAVKVLRSHEFAYGVRVAPCPHGVRSASCSDGCLADRALRAILYCEDPAPYEREVGRILRVAAEEFDRLQHARLGT